MTSIISGGLKIVSGIISGNKRSKASRRAEDAILQSQREAISSAERIAGQQQENISPYKNAGLVGLNRLTKEIGDGSLTRRFTEANLEKDDGYKFRLQEGERALNRQNNAAVGIFSGRQLRDAQRYGQNFAMGEYDRARARWNEDLDRRYEKFFGLANLGQTAVSGANASLSELGGRRNDAINSMGQAGATGAQERGLIGAQKWASIIDNSIGIIENTNWGSIFGGGGG